MRIAYLVATLLSMAFASLLLMTRAQGQTPAAPRVGVVCMSTESAFPFAAGTDRCFQEINGKMLVPTAVTACFIQGADYQRVTFLFSTVANPQCGGLAAWGNPATEAQYGAGLAALGTKEKAFFLEHLGSRP